MTENAPAGWYPDAHGHLVFWDGQQWTQHIRDARMDPNRKLVVGITSGENAVHLVLTVLTLGLWAPVWLLRRWAGRSVIR